MMLTLGGDIAAVPSGLADATGRRPRVEVGERLRFESLIIDLAAGFISIDPERVVPAIGGGPGRDPLVGRAGAGPVPEGVGTSRSAVELHAGDERRENRLLPAR